MASFYRRLSPIYRRRATLVGIHNYGDVNRKRTNFTRDIIRRAHRYNGHTRFWLTETGGIVKLGRSFACSTARAAARLSWMFHLARVYADVRHRPPLHLQLDGSRLRRALRRPADLAGWRPARRLPVPAQGAPRLLRYSGRCSSSLRS
jgi:hypothetical protein